MRKQRGFTILELMVIVCILGILSAAALPAYTRYIRRAATVEATLSIRRMYDGAVAYFLGEHADIAGNIQRRFPDSVGPTPAVIPPGIKVLVSTTEWAQPAWAALTFSVNDPQRFSYSFNNNNLSGAAAAGQVIAQGDLNANGVFSTYERTLQATNEGVQGGAALTIINELE
jgi:prepilin-type N-terminal cleavage/methylation domain-containing protein